jgi:hypothetical protein
MYIKLRAIPYLIAWGKHFILITTMKKMVFFVALISAIADVSKLYHHTVNVVVKWHSVLVRLF